MRNFSISELNIWQQLFVELISKELAIRFTGIAYPKIKEFGYRQILSNGATFGFCTRANGESSRASNSQDHSASYEKLRRFYSKESSNSLVIYRRTVNKTANKIEGFYFLSARKDAEIIRCYLNCLEVFEDFINLVSLYANLAVGSIKAGSLSAQSLQEELLIKIFSRNSIELLFPNLNIKQT